MKVQRPGALSTISKDLYVMRRGVGVYESLVKRFTAQTTDYQQLLSTFAEGLYTGACTVHTSGGVCVEACGLGMQYVGGGCTCKHACSQVLHAPCTTSYCSCRQGAQTKPCSEET